MGKDIQDDTDFHAIKRTYKGFISHKDPHVEFQLLMRKQNLGLVVTNSMENGDC